ncbi:unnamed protein product [Lepeophtheirus salmonis]|uniref:(salmon louse) hypothetical protein n=1 Tax=Lepeophtheirus salmonis TaxID=72036 RepID=A0A7R8H5U3_LEPSM|nr:unnamed protein product [Lepeophtheirus salmonis]CAF2869710.1 unnamed protein product [Lepeophtheirus salmonis]
MGERCGNALEAAEARKAEREAKRIEEDKKYSGMKPVQAMFNKSIAARTSENKSVFKANPTVPSVSVSDIKDKVRRKSLIAGGSSRNSIDLDFIPDLPVQSALDKNSNLEIVTRPVPAQRSKIGCGGGLPDMFEQQRKRESYVSLNKQKDTEIINKESINSCLDKFEDSKTHWTQRELDKKKEDENALKRVEDDNKRLENEEAFQKQMQEMGQDRTKFMEPDPGKNSYPKEEKENDTMTNKVKENGVRKKKAQTNCMG